MLGVMTDPGCDNNAISVTSNARRRRKRDKRTSSPKKRPSKTSWKKKLQNKLRKKSKRKSKRGTRSRLLIRKRKKRLSLRLSQRWNWNKSLKRGKIKPIQPVWPSNQKSCHRLFKVLSKTKLRSNHRLQSPLTLLFSRKKKNCILIYFRRSAIG